MRKLFVLFALLAGAVVVVADDDKDKDGERQADYARVNRVLTPRDGSLFDVAHTDLVRLTGPAPGTGNQTKLEVTEGGNRVWVVKRAQFEVVNGKPVTIGGGAPEFDVVPRALRKGVVKLKLTVTPPGGNPEVKEFAFEIQ